MFFDVEKRQESKKTFVRGNVHSRDIPFSEDKKVKEERECPTLFCQKKLIG